jgi:uncharacterized protein YaiI (UPF0178 family)
VGDAPQEVDVKVLNLTSRGDLVVTQDFGLAALALARGAAAISPRGKVFRAETIEFLLEEREIKSKIRKMGGRVKGPSKRTNKDNMIFRKNIFALLKEFSGDNVKGEHHKRREK